MAGAAPQGVPVFAPDGTIGYVPELDAQAMLQGYRPASPEDVAKAKAEEQYGGAGQAIGAGAEGFVNALTFGGGTAALRAAGLTTKEGEEGRKQAHPFAHAVGTAAGVVAPLVAGATAPEGIAELADLTAPNLISGLGQGVAKGVEGELPGAVGRIAPAVAGGAAEGAAYAGSDVVEKKLLGDPQLTWEKAAAEVGLGGLFGGALGGAGKSLAELMPDNLAESLSDKLGETAGARNIKAASGPGGAKALITKLQRQVGGQRALTQIGREMGENGLVGPLTTAEDTFSRAVAMQKDVGPKMTTLLEGMDQTDLAPVPVEQVMQRARQEIVQPMLSNPLDEDIAQKLSRLFGRYESEYSVRPEGAWPDPLVRNESLGFSDLHKIRMEVDDELYGLRGQLDPMANKFKDALHDFRGILNDELDRGLGSQASDVWRGLNRKYQVASVARQLADYGQRTHMGNNLASLTEIMAALTGAASHGMPAGALAGLGMHFAREHASGIIGWAATAAQRRLIQLATKSDRAIDQAIDALFSGAGGPTGGMAASGGTQHFAHGGEVEGGFSNVATALRGYSGNLDSLASHVSQQTGALKNHAPAAADAAHAFAARVVQHLTSKLPQQEPGEQLILDEPFAPSASELAEFNRHREVASRGPVAVLEHMKAGTLQPEHLEASQAIYPKLHSETVQRVAHKMANVLAAKKRIPAALRGPLGLLLGGELEHAHSGEGVLSAQTALASDAQQQPPPTGKGPGKPREVETKGAERLATGSQSTALHMAERT